MGHNKIHSSECNSVVQRLPKQWKEKNHCPTVCTIGRMFIFGGFECKCNSVFHVRESHDPSNIRRLKTFLMPLFCIENYFSVGNYTNVIAREM